MSTANILGVKDAVGSDNLNFYPNLDNMESFNFPADHTIIVDESSNSSSDAGNFIAPMDGSQPVVNDAELFKFFLNEEELSDDSIYKDVSSPHEMYGLSSYSPDSSPPQVVPSSPDSLRCDPQSPLSMDSVLFDLNEEQSSILDSITTPQVTIKSENNIQPAISKATPAVFTATPSTPKAIQPAANTNTKKRDRASTGVKAEAPLALSREELLKLSSKTLDNYTSTVTQGRQLSVDEERQLKKQRRLVKNRESAQLSRLRKKMYIEELEKKVNALTQDNEHLTKQLAAISTDRNKLQQEVLYLQSIIKQQQPNANLGTLSTQVAGKKPYNPKNVKAASVCLLIVLFSFGILFKATNPNVSLLPAISEDISFTGRTLQSLSDGISTVSHIPTVDSSLQLRKEALLPVKSEPMEDNRPHSPKRSALGDSPRVAEDKRKRMKIADDSNEVIAPSDSLVPVNSYSQVEKVSNELAYNIRDKPNTSYIYCSEAQHIAPAVTSSTPETVALLIPSNLLNMTSGIDPSLLEVSCQVLSYYLWPMRNATST
mmetsp:Transcript_14404/g.20087  ORF Transcript_14404/g.20087 Transcript_14404/m.20087 type:complete len:543 (-) Transcript_14404:67-1695(-)